MTHSAGPVRLTASQRRHYEVLFARLERTLIHLDEAAKGGGAGTSLTIVEADLPAPFVRDGGDVIGQARQQLLALAELLSLEPRTESRRRVCRALITAELNGLTDATSTRLRGFGDVDPSVAAHLDAPLEQLRATVARLADLLS